LVVFVNFLIFHAHRFGDIYLPNMTVIILKDATNYIKPITFFVFVNINTVSFTINILTGEGYL